MQRKWYARLKAEGFEDIEATSHTVIGPANSRRYLDATGYCEAVQRRTVEALETREPFEVFAALMLHHQGKSTRAIGRTLGISHKRIRLILESEIHRVKHAAKWG